VKHKILANTSEKIPIVGQGMGIGGFLAKNATYGDKHIRALRTGIDLGMVLVDTAEEYGLGKAEEILGKAIEGIREEVFISTKFSPQHNSRNDVLRACEGSLRRLKTDYIDLYQPHWPNPKVPLEETVQAMEWLVKEGKVRYVGVSNFSLSELKEARAALTETVVASVQVEYNLFDRSIEDNILPYCEREQITTIAYSPLDRGRIGGGDDRASALQAIANKYGKTPAQITLRWLTINPTVVVIPNATNEMHVRENASSADFDLAEGDFEEISKVFRNQCVNVQTDSIKVYTGDDGSGKVYLTIEEAIENKFNLTPSPIELSEDIKKGDTIKPVRLKRSVDKSGKVEYDLIEGRVRYWAWVIAHNGKVAIPAYVRED
jgi:diketogulonate reductase-like aldo/keto reductase